MPGSASPLQLSAGERASVRGRGRRATQRRRRAAAGGDGSRTTAPRRRRRCVGPPCCPRQYGRARALRSSSIGLAPRRRPGSSPAPQRCAPGRPSPRRARRTASWSPRPGGTVGPARRRAGQLASRIKSLRRLPPTARRWPLVTFLPSPAPGTKPGRSVSGSCG